MGSGPTNDAEQRLGSEERVRSFSSGVVYPDSGGCVPLSVDSHDSLGFVGIRCFKTLRIYRGGEAVGPGLVDFNRLIT